MCLLGSTSFGTNFLLGEFSLLLLLLSFFLYSRIASCSVFNFIPVGIRRYLSPLEIKLKKRFKKNKKYGENLLECVYIKQMRQPFSLKPVEARMATRYFLYLKIKTKLRFHFARHTYSREMMSKINRFEFHKMLK